MNEKMLTTLEKRKRDADGAMILNNERHVPLVRNGRFPARPQGIVDCKRVDRHGEVLGVDFREHLSTGVIPGSERENGQSQTLSGQVKHTIFLVRASQGCGYRRYKNCQ